MGGRTQILLIGSANRTSGRPTDFWLDVPHGLLKAQRQGGSIRLTVLDAVVNRSWYSIAAGVNTFRLTATGLPAATLTLPVGYHTVLTLRAALAALLGAAWTVEYDKLANTYAFRPPADGRTYGFDFSAAPACAGLLGFAAADKPTGTAAAPLRSSRPIKINVENRVLVHCNLPKAKLSVVDNLTEAALHESDVLLSMPITAAPFDNVVYAGSDLAYDLVGGNLDRLHFWLTDETNRPLEVPYDWTLTLKLEYAEGPDAAEQVAADVAAVRDYLRYMVLSDPKLNRD